MGRARGKLIVGIVAAGIVLAAAPASARDLAVSTQPAARRLVEIAIAGDAKSRTAVETVLRERVTSHRLDPSFAARDTIESRDVLAGGPKNDARLAVVWIDLADAEHANLFVVDEANERVLVRKVARHDNPEVTYEEIGHIVELTLEALVAGELIGMTREAAREELLPPAPEPAAAPVAAPPIEPPPDRVVTEPSAPPASWNVGTGLGYAARVPGGGLGVAHTLGAHFELLRFRRDLGFGGILGAEYRFPATAETENGTVRAESGAFTLLGAVGFASPRRNVVELALGGGLELVHVGGEAAPSRPIRFTERTDVVPFVRALVRYRHRTSPVPVFVGFGADLPIADKRYSLERGAEQIVLFDPWRVRPFATIGIETP